MGWISIPQLSKSCEDFIKNNPQLNLSKFSCRNGNFIFYRKYVTVQNVKSETADIRICFVKNDKGIEGWMLIIRGIRENGRIFQYSVILTNA